MKSSRKLSFESSEAAFEHLSRILLILEENHNAEEKEGASLKLVHIQQIHAPPLTHTHTHLYTITHCRGQASDPVDWLSVSLLTDGFLLQFHVRRCQTHQINWHVLRTAPLANSCVL